ncbi:hypothetical protein L6164_030784 [Bauhinia variegata]|uniref:Uncharacterized protein n=1 Tax=Bauhinia variegata TaxID=167791 RepID=A0ACB9LDS7_BAUVA|nr:hypothetical protein L6164_030784 [Bauhinia variegata]
MALGQTLVFPWFRVDDGLQRPVYFSPDKFKLDRPARWSNISSPLLFGLFIVNTDTEELSRSKAGAP